MKSMLYAVCIAASILLSVGSCSHHETLTIPSFSQVLSELDWGEGTTTYVIGHKSPDTDAVCSAITYAYLMNALGYSCEARVAGVNSLDESSQANLRNRMLAFMPTALESKSRKMVFTMLLNKKDNYTDIVYYGEGAKEAAEAAFGPSDTNYIRCQGQLSRKNDFIPAISQVLKPQ